MKAFLICRELTCGVDLDGGYLGNPSIPPLPQRRCGRPEFDHRTGYHSRRHVFQPLLLAGHRARYWKVQ
jgi:hypothetical protein